MQLCLRKSTEAARQQRLPHALVQLLTGRVCQQPGPAQRVRMNVLSYSPYPLYSGTITALSSSKMAGESENIISEAAEKQTQTPLPSSWYQEYPLVMPSGKVCLLSHPVPLYMLAWLKE